LGQVPASILGAYNQNRLFVANAGSEFTGGDPTGSLASGINPPITFAEVMTVGSQYYGQLFQLPTAGHSEQITYMGFLQMADTSTGIGPMIVGSSKAIYTYNTQNPRATWVSATSNTPFGSLFCYDAGIVGARAFANVNSDAFFLAADGYVRSLSMSRSQQSTWARVPLSREVENWFKYWDKSLINLSFVSYFRNKVFFSVNPYRQAAIDYDSLFTISDYAFGGLVVMELDSLTAFGQASKPIWAGLWTGIRPMDMVTIGDGGDRAFVIAKDNGINRLYEIDPDITYDTADNKARLVRSRIYTKEYDFKDPFQNKEIHSINFNFDTIQGDFTLDLKYKPSHAACFSPWRTFNFYAPWRTFDIPDGCILDGYAGQHIRDFTFGAPNEDLCSPVTSDFFKVFRKIQLEITITAKYWEIHEIKVNAMPKPLSPLQTICDPFPKVAVCDCKSDDWEIFPFEDCTKLIT